MVNVRRLTAIINSLADFLLVVLVLILVRMPVEASLSGFYVDNGLDQTVMHRMLTANDAQHVEHEILDLLGLPDRPSGRKLRHPSMRKSAPKFLLDVYRRLSEQESGGTGGRHTRSIDGGDDDDDNLITAKDREAIEQSDIIMTFLSKSKCDARIA